MNRRSRLLLGSAERAIAATLPAKRVVSSPSGLFNVVAPFGLTDVQVDDEGLLSGVGTAGSFTIRQKAPPA